MYDKEAVYDEKINPLIAEIIKVCKENQIHMLASFYLREDNGEDGDLYCTSHVYDEQAHSDILFECNARIYRRRKPFFAAAIITKRAEGS